MFNNHTMSLVTDLRIIGPAINNPNFVTIAAITTSEYPRNGNIYNASVLVPPIEILTRWADGDQMVMQFEYPRYLLTSPDADNMIIALLAALTKRNIILYIPNDEFGIFGQLLLNHLYVIYGVTVITPTTQFNIMPEKIPLIMAKFYSIGVMDANDFLASYPANIMLPDFIINKLNNDLRPYNVPMSFEDIKAYFNKLNASKDRGPLKQMVEIIGDSK